MAYLENGRQNCNSCKFRSFSCRLSFSYIFTQRMPLNIRNSFYRMCRQREEETELRLDNFSCTEDVLLPTSKIEGKIAIRVNSIPSHVGSASVIFSIREFR